MNVEFRGERPLGRQAPAGRNCPGVEAAHDAPRQESVRERARRATWPARSEVGGEGPGESDTGSLLGARYSWTQTKVCNLGLSRAGIGGPRARTILITANSTKLARPMSDARRSPLTIQDRLGLLASRSLQAGPSA